MLLMINWYATKKVYVVANYQKPLIKTIDIYELINILFIYDFRQNLQSTFSETLYIYCFYSQYKSINEKKNRHISVSE